MPYPVPFPSFNFTTDGLYTWYFQYSTVGNPLLPSYPLISSLNTSSGMYLVNSHPSTLSSMFHSHTTILVSLRSYILILSYTYTYLITEVFYLLPKLHKNPYKSRFISNSSHCSTTILSKHITSALTAVKDHAIKYSETAFSNSKVNYFWSIKKLFRGHWHMTQRSSRGL